MRASHHVQLALFLVLPAYAAVLKVVANHDCMAQFYDGASTSSTEQEDGRNTSTHSDAVMAEERRLADEHKKQKLKDFVRLATSMQPIYQDDNPPESDLESDQRQQPDAVERDAADPKIVSSPKQQLKRQTFGTPWLPPAIIVPVYHQCGGKGFSDPVTCEFGTFCQQQDEYYWQCQYLETPIGYVDRWGQCGGEQYTGNTLCRPDTVCVYQNQFYSQCL